MKGLKRAYWTVIHDLALEFRDRRIGEGSRRARVKQEDIDRAKYRLNSLSNTAFLERLLDQMDKDEAEGKDE